MEFEKSQLKNFSVHFFRCEKRKKKTENLEKTTKTKLKKRESKKNKIKRSYFNALKY